MNIQDTVDFHLRSTLFATKRMYNVLAAENGITQGIGYVLINIGKEGIPATKIAPIMGITSSSLSRLLKSMEDDGYIYRKNDNKDKRVVKVFVTEKGLKQREMVKKAVVDFNKRVMAKITPEEMETFEKVNALIREQVQIDMDEFLER
ncbi:MAG: MarR family transcriptional regulator [Marinilabiliales bacterium]|nr:MAG: MarR family transcriptional regulator [Marinilabiliales bacterium]